MKEEAITEEKLEDLDWILWVRFRGLEKILVLGALIRPNEGERGLEKGLTERKRDEFVLRTSWILGLCRSDDSADDFILFDI